MVRFRAVVARAAILAFAAAAAFYALYVSSLGRLMVPSGEPAGPARFLSELAASLGRNGIADMLRRLGTADFCAAALLFAAVCLGGEMCFEGRKRAALRRAAARGLMPALAVLAVLWVLFRLNNTSLFAWNYGLRGNAGYPLFGAARAIRRDEFALWTPMALSQEYIGWPGVSSLMGQGTDVTWISMGGLPAWNAAAVFKPLYWGFLLLGADRGLSLLCVSRLALLFAVSRRTAMLYTGNHRAMSFTAAVILTLSPMTQWFISQSIAEVLIFGQGMVLAVHGLLRSGSPRSRALYGLLNGWLLGCLVLVGYPAWILPMLYIVLAAVIYLFARAEAGTRGKKAVTLLLTLLPSLALLGVVVWGSWDTLQAIRSSVYPGHRLITGGLGENLTSTGGAWNPGFQIDLASLFFPLENMAFNASNCVDAAPFLGFAPAGAVLSVAHQWRERKADPLEILILSILAFFWLFTFVPLPAWFCRLTLLSQCSRPIFPIGLCEIFLLIRSRARGGIRDPRLAAAAAAASAGMNLAGILLSGMVAPTPAQTAVLGILYLFLFTLLYLDSRRTGKRLLVFFLCCVLLLAGGFVNPVQRGLDMLEDFELVRTLKSIPNGPEDLYAMEALYPMTNVPLMAGKRCINTDQPYADLKRWAAVDPEGKYTEVYNRLCHVGMDLAEPGEETAFSAEDNYIFVRLTRADLAALGVNYLITPRDRVENATLVAPAGQDHLYIWKLN